MLKALLLILPNIIANLPNTDLQIAFLCCSKFSFFFKVHFKLSYQKKGHLKALSFT